MRRETASAIHAATMIHVAFLPRSGLWTSGCLYSPTPMQSAHSKPAKEMNDTTLTAMICGVVSRPDE